MDKQIPPIFYRTLSCLPNSFHHKMLEQGKGTEDHLLPLGDWLSVAIRSYHSMTVIPDHSLTILPLILKGFQVDHEPVHQKDKFIYAPTRYSKISKEYRQTSPKGLICILLLIAYIECNPGPTGLHDKRSKVCAGCSLKADRPLCTNEARTLR